MVSVTNDSHIDWNPVWDVRTGRFDGGWTVEVRIPFKSIKYSPGTSQLWGLQLRRAIRRKNEWSHLTAVSRAAAGEIIVFLDSDMVPEREWLAAHARWHHIVSDAVVNGFRRHVEFDGIEPDAITPAVAAGRLGELLADREIEDPEWIDFHMARTKDLTAGHHDNSLF